MQLGYGLVQTLCTARARRAIRPLKRGMMLNLMAIPHALQMNEIFPTSRTTDDSGRCMLTGGPDVCGSQARVTTLVMAENHTKTKSSGVQRGAVPSRMLL